MITIWTMEECHERAGRYPYPIDLEFTLLDIDQIFAPNVSEILTPILERIEGTKVVLEDRRSGVYSKFSQGVLSLERLSSGSKTAIVIACRQLSRSIQPVDITEAGPVALNICLTLLDKTDIPGVITSDVETSDNFKHWDITFNGKPCSNWMDVLTQMTEGMDFHDED